MPPRSSPSTSLPCFRGNIGDDDHDDNDFPFHYQDDHDDGGVMMMKMLMIIMLLRHDIQVLYWLCRAHKTMFFDLKGAQAA